MRGHGETARLNPDAPKYRGFSPGDWEGVLRDIDAAKRTLIDAGADPDRIGIVGASIGANLSTWYAGATEGIHALVLLSPGREYKGVEVAKPFAAYGKRPSLLLAGEGDQYSAETCRELNASAEGFCELREFPGTYHGTDLLDASPNVAAQILEWCDTALKHATDPEEAR
jgi:dienelactone hydrolase